MALTPGTRLGVYEVVASIGEGGMGQVFRARDTKLDRDVAIKILPEAFAHDADRLARFQREAKTLASLNHPNIAAIHGLEESGGVTALVMELVEGDDLSQRIARGAIPLDEALPIAKQIAEALEAAHEQGIVHRDLKPANIKVRPDGTVKVLDFGLAKAMEPAGALSASASIAPTITTPAMTQAGMILGTAAYLSPEQAKGRTVDKRSDVWAFGAVLYEMLTGVRAFKGEDVSDTLAAVLRGDPDWTALPSGTPPAISRLLRRCLTKDRARRLADIADARLELIEDVQAPKTPEHGSRGRLANLGWAAAALMTVVAVVALLLARAPEATPHVTRFVITTPPTHDVFTGGGGQLALSPDGGTLVYVGLLAEGGRRLFRRTLDQLDAQPIQGTEGDVVQPFFSPDGQWLGFMMDNGTVRKVRLSGGVPETVSDLAGRGAAWRSNGTIVFAGRLPGRGVIDSRLFQIPAAGGTPTPIGGVENPAGSDGQNVGRIYPKMLSSGDVVAFTLWTGSLDSARVGVRSLRTGEERALMAGSSPQLLSTGHLLFARQNSIWASRFDATQLQAIGDSVRVVENVQVNVGGLALFAVSVTGTLAYVPGVSGGQRALVWVDRQGREEPLTAPRRGYRSVRLSPDGLQVALETQGTDGKSDIYVWDGPRSSLVRFTSDPATDTNPVWTRDGRRLVFASARTGRTTAFAQAADGTGQPEQIVAADDDVVPYAVTPDGARVAVLRSVQQGLPSLSLLSMSRGRLEEPLMSPSAGRLDGFAISSDGQWLAYQSDESGRFEVYVRPFPKVNDGRFVVSRNGGTSPVWSRRGDELFYFSADGQLMSAAVRSQAGFSVGEGKTILGARYAVGPRTYDVSPDGQRFLMIKDAGAQIVVVENWLAELRAKVPTGQ